MGNLEEITKDDLEEPTFDLIGWYTQMLAKRNQPELQNGLNNPTDDEDDDPSPQTNGTHACPPDHELEDCCRSEGEDMAGPIEGSGLAYDDLPGLDALSESDDEDDDAYQTVNESKESIKALADLLFEGLLDPIPESINRIRPSLQSDEDRMNQWIKDILTDYQPFPGDGQAIDPTYEEGDARFVIKRVKNGLVSIYDRVQGFDAHLHPAVIQSPGFSMGRWYAEQCAFNSYESKFILDSFIFWVFPARNLRRFFAIINIFQRSRVSRH